MAHASFMQTQMQTQMQKQTRATDLPWDPESCTRHIISRFSRSNQKLWRFLGAFAAGNALSLSLSVQYLIAMSLSTLS